jgi:hypothetical protein
MLWYARPAGEMVDFKVEAAARHAARTEKARDRPSQDAGYQRLLNVRGWHHDRESAVLLRRPASRAHHQSGGTGLVPDGDCPQGLAVLKERLPGQRLCGVHP